ncbi:hypothetical protein [Phycicoccus sp. Soil802]|uniref:hypothetical protein n=1 Tax=Phycicoccus sp. Soil802 TaxID=1736414 RepID=UPI00070378D9|nr:hypothetical protein [Phycicoccus sp. Soil802]KRF28934.1 hypothetical protein ASG91_04705 [Phycicoccus sp. Soil802]
MIPTFEVVPSQPVNPEQLIGSLTVQEWEEGWDGNRAYGCICRYDWDEANDQLRYESIVLRQADAGSSKHEEFEAFLEELDVPHEYFTAMDVGVAGLVLALTCAGLRTSSSCRGHVRDGQPAVRAAATPAHVAYLQPLALESGCTVVPENGQIVILAPDVLRLVALGKAIVDDRAVAGELGYLEVTGDLEDDQYYKQESP